MNWCERLDLEQARQKDIEASLITQENVESLVWMLIERGVRLCYKHGELQYSTGKGQLSMSEVGAIKENRAAIIALLERYTGYGGKHKPRNGFSLAPLAYSQQAHWNLYHLSEYPSGCIVSSVVRIQGGVSIDALQKSIAANVRRHEALRTRIIRHNGAIVQEITNSDEFDFHVSDCRGALDHQDLRGIIDSYVLGPVDIVHESLFRVCLVRISRDDNVLIIAAEHMVSDAYSMEILLKDILVGYAQAVKGQDICLPAVQTQFADYAVWQRNTEGRRRERLAPYWNDHLSECRRVEFPVDAMIGDGSRHGWGAESFVIDKELKDKLRQWCRAKKTTMVMAVFAAYVCVVFRWCETSDAVVSYRTSGRFSPAISNTVGYLATPLYIRIRCSAWSTLADVLNMALEEYCTALEYRDLSYLEALEPRPEFTRNSCFNWIQETRDIGSMDGSEQAPGISYSRVPLDFSEPNGFERDAEPLVVFMGGGEEVAGAVQFPRSRFSSETMQRFGKDLLEFIRILITSPERRMSDVALSR